MVEAQLQWLVALTQRWLLVFMVVVDLPVLGTERQETETLVLKVQSLSYTMELLHHQKHYKMVIFGHYFKRINTPLLGDIRCHQSQTEQILKLIACAD